LPLITLFAITVLISLIQECKVHEGFYYAFSDIKNQIMDKLKSYEQIYNQKNIMYEIDLF